MSSSLIGCPIQSALCHIEAKSFVNYITIPEKVDPPQKKQTPFKNSSSSSILCKNHYLCVCVCENERCLKSTRIPSRSTSILKNNSITFYQFKKERSLHFEPSPLMMAYEGSKSTWEEKFGKFIYHLKPEIRTRDRKLKRILIKLYRQHVYIIEPNLFERSWLVGWLDFIVYQTLWVI